MGFGDELQKRINEMREKGAKVPEVLKRVAKDATNRAVGTAVEKTPPNRDTPPRGANTITGQLQSHWEIDSRAAPEVSGKEYKTLLANNMQYASYVNNGHHMNPDGVEYRFVPGLMIDEHTGLLEKVDRKMGGIMVKQQWIEGLYMREAAVETYKEVVNIELDKSVKELFGG